MFSGTNQLVSCRHHRHPPLQRTQGRGTLCVGDASEIKSPGHPPKVAWKVDPARFIRKNLSKTLKVYYGMIQMANYDPQKVGKTGACYYLAANDFGSRLP